MRLRETIQGVAEEIAGRLVQELKSRAADEAVDLATTAEELANDVALEVAKEISQRIAGVSKNSEPVDLGIQERLATVESRLAKLAESSGNSSEDEELAGLPNLKYAKSKYRNVESMLKYIENKETEGGVKLVIMNFND